MDMQHALPCRSFRSQKAEQPRFYLLLLLLLLFFFNILFGFFFLKICLFYVCEYIAAVSRNTRRGHQISLLMVVSHHVVAGI